MKTNISIDDGIYPTFNLTHDKISSVEVDVTPTKLKAWEKAFKAYRKSQKEMEDAVNYYEPIKLKKIKELGATSSSFNSPQPTPESLLVSNKYPPSDYSKKHNKSKQSAFKKGKSY